MDPSVTSDVRTSSEERLDPTAIGTLGVLLLGVKRMNVVLFVIPTLWCAISGATLLAMKSPDALVTPLAALLVTTLAVGKAIALRRARSTSLPDSPSESRDSSN